ncbi:hypothetical protein TrVFT333_005874 [Trichoderma virens FT-333]|nr:hypothetical protein TrVFT333_005874 [Trichoderma virens FT-333]
MSKIQELESILDSHGIPFEGLGTSWIRSHWEEKLATSPQNLANSESISSSETAITAEAYPIASGGDDSLQDRNVPLELGEQNGTAWLWQPDEELEEKQSTSTDTAFSSPSVLTLYQISTPPGQLELHPNSRHVFRLWQAFADNVNPLSKIIHAPTLQEKILGAAWAVESAPKPLEATMLAVYTLAIVSMKPATCFDILGESIDSNHPVALALRIAHKMGLHRAAEDSIMPFFKQEMQVRLWWYIRGLNSRVRRGMGLLSTIDDLGDARLPMNVNDADLHPRMEKPPAVQHTAATEMVYCLMKYDLWSFVRKSSNFSGSLNPREKAAQLITSTSVENLIKKKKVLGEIDRMLQEKYLAHLDQSIPLHQLSAALAGLTVHNQQFLMLNPRHQPEGGRYMSKADQNLVFESSVRLLELNYKVRSTSFSTNLVDHMVCRTQVDALVYMISELRRRTSGHLVETAWDLLEEVYSHQTIVFSCDQKFYAALADLTIQAWEARRKALNLRSEIPQFIETLQAVRERPEAMVEPVAGVEVLQTGLMGDLMQDEPLDWNYWNELLEL